MHPILSLKRLSEIVCCLQKQIEQGDIDSPLEDIPSVGQLRVASSVADGETVTIGSYVFEVVLDGGTPLPGRIVVDLTASGTAAKADSTLTASGNASDGDTVTIGSTVYTLAATPSSAYDVQLGGSAADTLANLAAAINGSGTPGVEYFAGTLAHPDVVATTVTATTIDVEAKIAGAFANTIDTLTDVSDFSWTGTDLANGANASAAEFIAAFETAVNALPGSLSADALGTSGVVVTDAQGRSLATSETLAGANNTWAAATLTGGQSGQNVQAVLQSRAATATEAAMEVMVFPFSFAPASAIVSVRTAAGVSKAWDGAVTISGNNVILTSSGSTDIASTDVVTVVASA